MKLESCIICHQIPVIAQGRCAAHYKAWQRARDKARQQVTGEITGDDIDAVEEAIRSFKKQKQMRKVINTILNAVEEGIEVLKPSDRVAFKALLKPYFDQLATGLVPTAEPEEDETDGLDIPDDVQSPAADWDDEPATPIQTEGDPNRLLKNGRIRS